jgi:nicotinate-nucleotide adenylyltransferase
MTATEPKRVCLLGGSFDPPHLGHLRLAQLAWEHLRLDELLFVPSCGGAQKRQPQAGQEARLSMLRQMLHGTPFGLESIELELGGKGYTIDTLEALNGREPDTAWVLAIGSDQAESFESWKEPDRILGLASISIAPRPSRDANVADVFAMPKILSARISCEWSGQPGQVVILPSTGLELASSRIKEQIAEGAQPSGLEEKVMATIFHEQLYSLNARRLDGP